jgi:Uri superfamily endonuclease
MATPGTYLLVLSLETKTKLEIGRLGELTLVGGRYCYVGSARGPGGLEGRLARHLRRRKRLHWHIDYLLQRASVLEIWAKHSLERWECAWVASLLDECTVNAVISGFGSSDCACNSHLLYLGSAPSLNDLHRQLRSLGAEPLYSLLAVDH